MKKKVIFILPYFGKLPGYFPFYLISCKYNQDFNWLIITDDHTPYDFPENVKVIYESFESIKSLIQSKFDFTISLTSPYKLCDFKPAYGYIFREYIANFDFWGHVDPDCIWGDLNKYITWELLNQYDKLYMLGHLSVFRNTMENNTIFMRHVNGAYYYKDIFSDEKCWGFDERIFDKRIHDIYSFYNIPVYEDNSRADVNPHFSTIRLAHYNKRDNSFKMDSSCFKYFEWNKGVLLEISYTPYFMKKNIKEHSYLHLHGGNLMKWKMIGEHFYIFRNRFVNYEKRNVVFFILIYLQYLHALILDYKYKKLKIEKYW